MSFGTGAVPRVYDEFDDGDTRLAPAALVGGIQGNTSYRGGTALMPAAIAPVLQGPAARFVAAHTPNRIQIRVAPTARRRSNAKPTPTEWAVAIAAGLFAAVGIGALAALI